MRKYDKIVGEHSQTTFVCWSPGENVTFQRLNDKATRFEIPVVVRVKKDEKYP